MTNDVNAGLLLRPGGYIEWHSSEEDGGPDVGVSLAIAEGIELWCGEISRKLWETADESVRGESDGGTWLVLYHAGDAVVLGPVDYSHGRELLEEVLSPALLAPAHARVTPPMPAGVTEGELIGKLKDLSDYFEPNDLSAATLIREAAGRLAHAAPPPEAVEGWKHLPVTIAVERELLAQAIILLNKLGAPVVAGLLNDVFIAAPLPASPVGDEVGGGR